VKTAKLGRILFIFIYLFLGAKNWLVVVGVKTANLEGIFL
jgi:hypothetical protein